MAKVKFAGLVALALLTFGGAAQALPADQFQLRLTKPDMSPWSASAFYHFSQTQGGVGLRADLGVQLTGALDSEQNSLALVHVQADSLVVGLSRLLGSLFSSPFRLSAAMDLRSPFSYLVEGQLYFPLGAFEPFATLRVQSTGFSVTGGDGYLYETGSASRFWLASASLGAAYSIAPDLRLAGSFTHRMTMGATELRKAGAVHFSMQWLWGAPTAQ